MYVDMLLYIIEYVFEYDMCINCVYDVCVLREQLFLLIIHHNASQSCSHTCTAYTLSGEEEEEH